MENDDQITAIAREHWTNSAQALGGGAMSEGAAGRRGSEWITRHTVEHCGETVVRVVSYDDLAENLTTNKAEFLDKCWEPEVGELRDIAILDFKDDIEPDEYGVLISPREQESLSDELIDALMYDVLSVNLSSVPSLLDFIKKHGNFTNSADARFENTLNDEGFVDGVHVEIEQLCGVGLSNILPLWQLVRAISLFRIVHEVFSDIREGRSSRICRMARVRHPFVDDCFWPPNTPFYPVEFAPQWLLPETREALLSFRRTTVDLPFEPKKPSHFLAAGWEFVMNAIRRSLGTGMGLSVRSMNLSSRIVDSLEEGWGKRYWMENNTVVPYSSDRDVTPPMFDVIYSVSSIEQSLYLRLLELAMRGSVQQQCPICQKFFSPKSGHYRYCSDHSEAEKKWWRRKVASGEVSSGTTRKRKN